MGRRGRQGVGEVGGGGGAIQSAGTSASSIRISSAHANRKGDVLEPGCDAKGPRFRPRKKNNKQRRLPLWPLTPRFQVSCNTL